MVRNLESPDARRDFDRYRKYCKSFNGALCGQRKHRVKCTIGNCPKLKKG